MKKKFQNIGLTLFYIGIFVVIILIAIFSIKVVLKWSIILFKAQFKLIDQLFSWLSLISAIAFLVCLFILLPLAIFRKTREFSGYGLIIASYVFGATLWVWSFLLTYVLWGVLALFIGLFLAGIGVVPIAMLATLFNGEWSFFGQLVLLLIFTFGSRILGYYLLSE